MGQPEIEKRTGVLSSEEGEGVEGGEERAAIGAEVERWVIVGGGVRVEWEVVEVEVVVVGGGAGGGGLGGVLLDLGLGLGGGGGLGGVEGEGGGEGGEEASGV